MSVNENETVNQSQSATAGGSGDSPEKMVADHVDRLWEHIAADGYDLLADVAVESLVKNQAVPFDAYLRSVKMSWCLHRAATYYARQYSVERVSADFARGDAQFEHSLRAQAEREAEKLKADLAQSALLVENLRLRVDEARTKETESPAAKWCRKIRELNNSLQQRQQELTASFMANQELRKKLETAEAALLEQQQRKRELRNEEQSVQALWGETRRRCEDLETLVADLQTASAAAEAALLEQQQRNEELVTQNSQQFMKIAELQRQVEAAKTQELEGKTQELEGQTQELQAGYTPPEGWRLLEVGEPLQNGDQWITESGAVEVLREVKTEIVQPNGHYIRQIQPEVVQPVQVCEGRWRTRGGDIKNIRACEPLKGAYYVWPWTDGFTTYQDNGRHLAAESNNDLVEYLGPIEPQVEAVTTNRGDDSGGN